MLSSALLKGLLVIINMFKQINPRHKHLGFFVFVVHGKRDPAVHSKITAINVGGNPDGKLLAITEVVKRVC